jgi:hypothetical protein
MAASQAAKSGASSASRLFFQAMNAALWRPCFRRLRLPFGAPRRFGGN